MNGCATLEEGERAGHKSRQLKKSCWPFKTSSHRHKRKRRYYIGERCLNIFSRSLLSPSLHPPSYFSIYILFSSLFSLFQRHSWRKRRGGVNLFAKSSRWNARGEREKIEKNDSMEEHATHSEWRAAFVFVRESPPPLNRSLPSFQWIYIHPMFKQPALLFDLREARNRAEWLNIDSPGSRETVVDQRNWAVYIYRDVDVLSSSSIIKRYGDSIDVILPNPLEGQNFFLYVNETFNWKQRPLSIFLKGE